MFKRYITIAGSSVLTLLLGMWTACELILDYAGRIDLMRGLGGSDSVFTKVLLWLLATPWEVPALLAAGIVVFWMHWTHRMLLHAGHAPVIDSVASKAPAPALSKQKEFRGAEFKPTSFQDHNLNSADLAEHTSLVDIEQKIHAIDIINPMFHEVLLPISLEAKYITTSGGAASIAKQADSFTRKLDAFSNALKEKQKPLSHFPDVLSASTVFGFAEMVQALKELSDSATKISGLPATEVEAVLRPYLDRHAIASRNFDRWREETGANLDSFRGHLRSRLLGLPSSKFI